MQEYSTNSIEGLDPETGMAMILGLLVFYLVAYLFIGFCLGKILQKAGKPLWAGFIPIYNLVVMLEVIGRPTWWIILLIFIPFMFIVTNIDLAKSFGKDTLWGILLTFFGIIILPIMAFSRDIQYVGPAAAQE